MNEAIAALVRRHDPDRFLTALFAPPDQRDALLTLYAFNHELARAREVVSEPPLALIRLQWWREVVEGARRRHEVAEPLRAALDAGELDRGDLLRVIDAREAEAAPAFETMTDWRDYLFGSAGGVAVAAGRLLGAPDPETLRPTGRRLWHCRSAAQHSRAQSPRSLPAAGRHTGRPWTDAGGSHRGAVGHGSAGRCAASCPRRIDVAETTATATTGHCGGPACRAGEARSPTDFRLATTAWHRRSAGGHVRRYCRPRLTDIRPGRIGQPTILA